MKKFVLHASIAFASASILFFLGSAASPADLQNSAVSGPTLASKLPTVIDLNDSTESEIREYYSSLISLDASERKGTNLLKNLKPILQDFTYYKYDDVWKIYEITDREWSLSPAMTDSENNVTYSESENVFTKYTYGTSNSKGGSNPYVHTLYRNRDSMGVTLENGRIKEWGDHNATGTNREHVWCQSRGFKAESGAEGPAGTDVHHLISGDGRVNQSYHNNSPYGYVDKSKEYKNASKDQPWLDGNLLGPQLHTNEKDKATKVFEPQDSDKGDIARAVFYMAACYNNWSGEEVITDFNPNLIIVDFATDDGAAESSSATHPVEMGILSDLLEWHKNDPVDEYEIHRNNLIYKNYQHNRNPFIDFPEWVDMIWGDADASANPSSDKIAVSISKHISLSKNSVSLEKGESATIVATTDDSSNVTWSIEDESIATIVPNGNSVTVTCNSDKGTTKLVASGTFDGVEEKAYCTINASSGQTGSGEQGSSSTKTPFEEFVDSINSAFPFLGPYGAYILAVVIIVIIIVIIVIVITKKAKRKAKKISKAVNGSSSKKKSGSKTKKK